jgi:hypothetical protein
MSDPKATAGDWALNMAGFAVDKLVDLGLVQKDHFAIARAAVAEEIYVWLCVEAYPPPVDLTTSDADDAKIFKWRREWPKA